MSITPAPARAERTVVLHYHLFKNAGTSLDHILKDNFGARWVTREFSARGNPAVHAQEVARWIQENPEAVAFSSHTMELPPPQIPGVRIIPLIFVRHPLDRIASAYSFERKQGGAGFGSVLARHTSLAGYVEVRLSMPADRQCRNFHSFRYGRMFPATEGTELERALRAAAALPFVGVVEDFDDALEQLAALLTPEFPDFKAKKVAANVSRDTTRSLADKLDHLREELGDATYHQLMAANSDDLTLYNSIVQRRAG